VGREGRPESFSKKSSRTEETPPKTRGKHQALACLDGQIAHESERQSGGTLKGLTEPLTYESDWFVLHEAVVHLRPYTQPHFPIVVAAAQSPVGMQLAGKYGAGVLSVSVIRDRGTAPDLHKFWQIAEETAAEHGHTVHRADWRMAVAV